MKPFPCSYSIVLDNLLGSTLKIGQGGRWEANTDQLFTPMVRLEALLSSCMAHEIKQTLGEKSREIVQYAAKGYGRYRGEEIRRRVEKMNLPLDIPHMWAWWDMALTSSGHEEWENNDLDPYYHGNDITSCPYHTIYEQYYPHDMMAMHCEAMHRAAFQGFNPAIEFWLPALLPRGEGSCTFRLRIPPDEAEKIERRKTGEPEPVRKMDDTATAYRLMARKVVIVFHFFMDALLVSIGKEQAAPILSRACSAWGEIRGREMREAHMARHLALNLENFVTYYDDPAAEDSWLAENVKLTPDEYHLEITKSAYSDYFQVLGTGPLSAIIYEAALPAQIRAYNPQLKMVIPRLIERGDDRSEYHYVMTR